MSTNSIDIKCFFKRFFEGYSLSITRQVIWVNLVIGQLFVYIVPMTVKYI